MKRLLAILLLLPFPAPAAPPIPGPTPVSVSELRIVFADVGHGDCVWITTPDDGIPGNGIYEGYHIVIDAGPSSKRIFPLLKEIGLRPGTPVEWMICSHAHNDHYRGLIGVLENCEVHNIAEPGYRSGGQAFAAFCWFCLLEPGANFYSPAIGISVLPGLKSLSQAVPYKLDWGRELEVEILHANPAVTEDTINLSSLVLRLAYGDFSVIFTGDIEGKSRSAGPERAAGAEEFLLRTYVRDGENRLASTVLKIPHHGSETSSTLPFIRAVGAREGVICAGNRYGLPDESVLGRYEKAGCRIWRTDRLDAGKPGSECEGDDHILFTSDGKGYAVSYLKPDLRECTPAAPAAPPAGMHSARDPAGEP